jgi:F-type H+-transporting ATPase subunit epsilon
MANTFHFELVSPEKIAFSGEADQVDVPGAEGDFGVFAGHAPLISLLRPGVVTVHAGGEQTKLVVLGGLAEVGPDGLTLLADVATSLEDLDRAALQRQIAEMEERVRSMEQGSAFDREITRLDHFKMLDQHLEGTAMH